jgi:hypothetical protein
MGLQSTHTFISSGSGAQALLPCWGVCSLPIGIGFARIYALPEACLAHTHMASMKLRENHSMRCVGQHVVWLETQPCLYIAFVQCQTVASSTVFAGSQSEGNSRSSRVLSH